MFCFVAIEKCFDYLKVGHVLNALYKINVPNGMILLNDDIYTDFYEDCADSVYNQSRFYFKCQAV